MAGGLLRPCLILGGASSLWDDVAAARELVDVDACTVIAVNDAGFAWPGRLDHWISMHAEELPERERLRADRGYPGGYVRWSRPYPPGMKHLEANVDRLLGGWAGSSGLLAVGVALVELGADPVLLCGMPMDDRPHFNRAGPWTGVDRYRKGWLERLDQIQGRVRSFGGWTAELLGVPTADWVLDRTSAARV